MELETRISCWISGEDQNGPLFAGFPRYTSQDQNRELELETRKIFLRVCREMASIWQICWVCSAKNHKQLERKYSKLRESNGQLVVVAKGLAGSLLVVGDAYEDATITKDEDVTITKDEAVTITKDEAVTITKDEAVTITEDIDELPSTPRLLKRLPLMPRFLTSLPPTPKMLTRVPSSPRRPRWFVSQKCSEEALLCFA